MADKIQQSYLDRFRERNPIYANLNGRELSNFIYSNHPTLKDRLTEDDFAEASGANDEIRRKNMAEMGDFSR